MFKLLVLINILTLSQIFFIKTCQPAGHPLIQSCIDTSGNYTNNSTYKDNLNTLLSSISTNNQISNGFYNLSVGQDPDKVNGIAFCRGDLMTEGCHSCIRDATFLLPLLCPTQKEAIIWYDNCTLRYSSLAIFGVKEEQPIWYLKNGANVTDPDQFKQALQNFLYRLQIKAEISQHKFATGEENITTYGTVYGLSQCSPDLSAQNCFECITRMNGVLLEYCADKIGARVFGPSCNVRYEPAVFYNLLTPPSPPPQPPLTNFSGTPVTSEGQGIDAAKAVIIITIPIGILCITLAIISCIIFRRGRSIRRKIEVHEDEDESISFQFDFKSIEVATNNFSEDNKLGEGGFGAVYKGILASGRDIAIKRLSKNSRQGNQEFKTEVLLVAKLQHRNLVRLLGFSLKDEEKLLIYEFLANGSLDHFLFDPIKRKYLDWEMRYNIITGIARGALYLHEESQLRIIHRDLKASNVLLGQDMNPKIADFGTARLFDAEQTQGDTSRVAGTYGYMAPEYALHGFFSVKSDVFSFGVMVLEIITGKKCNSLQNHQENTEDLLTLVWRNWRQKTALKIVDPTLTKVSRNNIMRCIHIGLLCVQEAAEARPSMSSVVLMLSSHSHSMPIPSCPAFVTGSGIGPHFSPF